VGGSVVAGLLMRSGEVRFPVSGFRWYVLGEFRVVAWCERQNCFTGGWDGTILKDTHKIINLVTKKKLELRTIRSSCTH